MKKHYRQGDVLVIAVSSLPKTAVLQQGPVILAHGEVTGHAHQIHSGASLYLDPETQATYVEIAEALAELRHEEHATIPLPNGVYRVIRQREYSPTEIRNVQD